MGTNKSLKYVFRLNNKDFSIKEIKEKFGIKCNASKSDIVIYLDKYYPELEYEIIESGLFRKRMIHSKNLSTGAVTEFNSIRHCSKVMDICRVRLRNILDSHSDRVIDNHIFKYSDELFPEPVYRNFQNRVRVSLTDIFGSVTYIDSLTETAHFLNVSIPTIINRSAKEKFYDGYKIKILGVSK